MGPTELIIIVFILLIIFGGKLIPKIGKNLGETIKAIRTISKSNDDDDAAGRTRGSDSGSEKRRSARGPDENE